MGVRRSVFGIDFKLGLGIDAGRFAQQDVAALLAGIGPLGIGSDVDQPPELADGIAACDTLHERIARAVRHVVRRAQLHDAMLALGGEKKPAHPAGGMRTVEVYPIGNVGAGQLYGCQATRTVGRLDRPDLGESLAQKDLGDLQLRPALQQERERRSQRLFVHDDKPRRNPGSDLDAQLRGIDGDERLHCVGIVPDAEPFAPDGPEPAENIGKGGHYSLYSFINQS